MKAKVLLEKNRHVKYELNESVASAMVNWCYIKYCTGYFIVTS